MATTTRKTRRRPLAEAASSADATLSEAATEVRRSARTAKSAARNVQAAVGDKARKATKAARTTAAEAADELANSTDAALDGRAARRMVDRAADGAADLLDQVRGTAHAIGSSDLAEETRTVVRRYPLLSGVAAMVAGFVVVNAVRGLVSPSAARAADPARAPRGPAR